MGYKEDWTINSLVFVNYIDLYKSNVVVNIAI